MPITYLIDADDRIVHLTTSGESNFQEWREAMLAALSDEAYSRGFNFLSDRSDETDVPDPEFTRAASQFIMQHRDEMDGAKWAAVSSNVALHGPQNLFASLSGATGLTVRVFGDRDGARRWLTQSDV